METLADRAGSVFLIEETCIHVLLEILVRLS